MNVRAVSHIAGKELRYIVFSPIGWIVLGVFAVQVGSIFVGLVEQVYEGLAFGRSPNSVARYIYTSSIRSVISQSPTSFISTYHCSRCLSFRASCTPGRLSF